MLEQLQHYSISLLNNQNIEYKRYFFDEVDFNNKLIGIIGDRGIGKTTFLLQYLNELDLGYDKKLYISAEFLLLNNVKLYEVAEEFVKVGGKVLVVDEIHHIIDFEKHLKMIYDCFDIQVLFSGSNAIKLEHSKADLSRRAILYRFGGMSFREFLELKTDIKFEKYSLEDILSNHTDIASQISTKVKPFEFWSEYLQYGYYPFYFQTSKSTFLIKLNETINTTIEHDLAYIFNIEPKFVIKLKQLVGLICASKPYELNITKLSSKIEINRNTLYQYIYYLSRGKIFNILHHKAKGDNIFNKPAKIYLSNTNLNYAYCNNIETGTIRESFFATQFNNYYNLHKNKSFLDDNLLASKKGDFLLENKYNIEIGGKDKSFKQIKDIPNSFVVADNLEIGFGNKIPLYLFGFLY
ncbi:MAG: AAA family ATPase [Campylobacterota bacterium]|nr:AAA family ATPase [Campylobacterota bacterium]